MKIKNYLIFLVLIISCSQNQIPYLINQKQRELYTSEQLQSSYTESIISYRESNRDTIFSGNKILKNKDFVLIESSSSVDGFYGGCLLTDNEKVGFDKSDYWGEMEFVSCNKRLLGFLSFEDNSRLEECSKKYPIFHSSTIFISRYIEDKLIVNKFQEFDLDGCNGVEDKW